MFLKMGINCLLVLFLAWVTVVTAKIKITNLKVCSNDKNHQYLLTKALERERNGVVEYDWTIDFKSELGNDNKYYVILDKIVNGKPKHLITLKGKGACKALVKYGGDIFKDVATKMKYSTPDKCPIPKRQFHLPWYNIDFEATPIAKLVPNAQLKMTIRATDLEDKELVCVDMTVDKS